MDKPVTAPVEFRAHLAHAAGLHLRWCRANGYRFPSEMLALANGGQLPPPREEHRERGHHGRVLLVNFEAASEMLATSPRSISRLVASGEVKTIGKGSGKRIPVIQLEDYIPRQLERSEAS